MLMDRIFRNSSMVVAWLGTNTAKIDTLLKSPAVLKGNRVPNSQFEFYLYTVLLDDGPFGFPTSIDKLGDRSAATIAGSIVKDLLNRPRWTRMWIVQELVLAKNLKLKYGNHQIDWDNLVFWEGQGTC